jgi:hypothetical protein
MSVNSDVYPVDHISPNPNLTRQERYVPNVHLAAGPLMILSDGNEIQRLAVGTLLALRSYRAPFY